MIKNQESGRLKYLLFVPTMLVLISMTIVPFIFFFAHQSDQLQSDGAGTLELCRIGQFRSGLNG